MTSITAIGPNPRNTPVSLITVTFNEPITQRTLTAADFTLTDNGTNVPIPASPPLGVTQTGTDTYQISGLDSETAAAGNYVLTVKGTTIDDLSGNSGTGTASTALAYRDTATSGVGLRSGRLRAQQYKPRLSRSGVCSTLPCLHRAWHHP